MSDTHEIKVKVTSFKQISLSYGLSKVYQNYIICVSYPYWANYFSTISYLKHVLHSVHAYIS